MQACQTGNWFSTKKFVWYNISYHAVPSIWFYWLKQYDKVVFMIKRCICNLQWHISLC